MNAPLSADVGKKNNLTRVWNIDERRGTNEWSRLRCRLHANCFTSWWGRAAPLTERFKFKKRCCSYSSPLWCPRLLFFLHKWDFFFLPQKKNRSCSFYFIKYEAERCLCSKSSPLNPFLFNFILFFKILMKSEPWISYHGKLNQVKGIKDFRLFKTYSISVRV